MTIINKPSISFCVTCCNRLWQIKQTLEENLNLLNRNDEIVLVNYGSTDDLDAWIWRNFESQINQANLIYFQVTNDVKWNVARAKNLAHRLSTKNYLFNLDADNYITRKDINLIRKVATLNMHCWQWSGSFIDGSYGRIGLPKSEFLKLGGYDETFLAMGGQDTDLLFRLAAIHSKRVRLPMPGRLAVQNSDTDKIIEVINTDQENDTSKKIYQQLNSLNISISKLKLSIDGPIRLGGGFSYYGLLNGKKVFIDGFNTIREI